MSKHPTPSLKQLAAAIKKHERRLAAISAAIDDLRAIEEHRRGREAEVRELLDIGKRCAKSLRSAPVDHASLLYDDNGIPNGKTHKTARRTERCSLEQAKALRARGKTRTRADAPLYDLDPSFKSQLEAGQAFMKQYSDVFEALAKELLTRPLAPSEIERKIRAGIAAARQGNIETAAVVFAALDKEHGFSRGKKPTRTRRRQRGHTIQSDLARLDRLTDEQINYEDIPPLTDESGEVRELTKADIAGMKPFKDGLPTLSTQRKHRARKRRRRPT